MMNTFTCGHPFTDDNSIRNGSRTRPRCRTCKNAYDRARRNAIVEQEPPRSVPPSVPGTPSWMKWDGPGDWVTRGSCRDENGRHAALFDPIDKDVPLSDEYARIGRAKQFCHGCPVRAQCRLYGQQHDLLGVWGGEYRSTSSRRERRAA